MMGCHVQHQPQRIISGVFVRLHVFLLHPRYFPGFVPDGSLCLLHQLILCAYCDGIGTISMLHSLSRNFLRYLIAVSDPSHFRCTTDFLFLCPDALHLISLILLIDSKKQGTGCRKASSCTHIICSVFRSVFL